ncbi:hypothetical protein BU24DRAFT_450382 [Aaosphaeria arxii CBS 175.79]|uniref:Acyltransferase 3 domain-containing protein n=1 Tax=Aaosphaeria arxii CBS 175.79 TaxID=1450172 RepID=A0A6A5XS19_9PLEO|nr:uncharacterized protein BU24DRAFT_450382 [Aaosphaeria arxii CBS 175.79]KAF2015709.1 hypothetical protein BU24DRAFT_450382 [Aaosphaeria arxii CBS 175.79]
MQFQLPSIPLPSRFSSMSSSSTIPSQNYLIGLRGLLAIQCFLFTFFQLFLPTSVADSSNEDGRLYQKLIRKTLSVLFWNESLIYSFIILLSARTLCLPYLHNPDRTICSSSIFRRALRLWLPTFVGFSLSVAAFSTTSTDYIETFLHTTGNVSTTAPLRMRTFLVYFNSQFDMFWVTKHYTSQAANLAFPSGTIWLISVIFQQSYTVYMTMITIPYTRTSWRVKAFIVFILTAWWVQSWAWYSVTGLLLADATLNMDLQFKSRSGIRVGRYRVPMWPIYGVLVFTGVLLQYLFIAWRPEFRHKELQGHTGLYTSGSLNSGVDTEQPQARDDNYLVILGTMLFVETYDVLQRVLRNRVLVGLGKRSFSIFLAQPILLYTAGIKLYMHMHASGISHEMATFVCFIVCVPLVGLAAEVFYRVIDLPSIAAAKETWAWLKR